MSFTDAPSCAASAKSSRIEKLRGGLEAREVERRAHEADVADRRPNSLYHQGLSGRSLARRGHHPGLASRGAPARLGSVSTSSTARVPCTGSSMRPICWEAACCALRPRSWSTACRCGGTFGEAGESPMHIAPSLDVLVGVDVDVVVEMTPINEDAVDASLRRRRGPPRATTSGVRRSGALYRRKGLPS